MRNSNQLKGARALISAKIIETNNRRYIYFEYIIILPD